MEADWVSQDPGDLDLEEGDRVLVIEKTSDDWYVSFYSYNNLVLFTIFLVGGRERLMVGEALFLRPTSSYFRSTGQPRGSYGKYCPCMTLVATGLEYDFCTLYFYDLSWTLAFSTFVLMFLG